MKDIKIYKRSYSHELIKKTKKYNFYGSKELIQVIIVGEIVAILFDIPILSEIVFAGIFALSVIPN